MSTICTLITGASSGIGQRIAIQLSQSCNVILCGRNADKLTETQSLCAPHNTHYCWPYDLENVSEISIALPKFLADNDIHIDTFVHSAGTMKVLHMRTADYKNALQLFNINFFSASEICALLLKKKVNKDGLKNIVFISAILGEFGAKGHNLYSSSKAALNGLMRSLAVEVAPTVRVNSVLPGGVRTPMSEHAYSDPVILQNSLKDYPLGIGMPEDVANMVEYLVSDKAKWITGQEFVVDGGRTINISNK